MPPHTGTAFPTVSIRHKRGTVVTTEELTLTQHSQPESMVHIRVHSWWFTFYGFAQISKDVYPPLWYTEYFYCLKILMLCAPPHSVSALNLPFCKLRGRGITSAAIINLSLEYTQWWMDHCLNAKSHWPDQTTAWLPGSCRDGSQFPAFPQMFAFCLMGLSQDPWLESIELSPPPV